MRTPLSATAQDAAIAGNFGTVSNDKTVTMATLTNQSMKYTSFYKRVQTWIHRPQKVQGLLLQWELRGKHQIRNVISRQSNVVECWNFVWLCVTRSFNSLRPGQNGRHFADDTLKRFFPNENVWISIKISLKFVPKAPINNIPSLVQIMAWRRPGDKPLSETMLVFVPTHICVTRPQWVKRYSCRPNTNDEIYIHSLHNSTV